MIYTDIYTDIYRWEAAPGRASDAAAATMGNKQTIFTEEQLDNYQDCTFFNKKDILKRLVKIDKI